MWALREMTAIALAVMVGFALSQLPNFVQEYEQRLGGALQEASHQLNDYQSNARSLGLTLDDYIHHHLENLDPIFQKTGLTIQNLKNRVASLGEQAQALSEASKLLKPWVLMKNYDSLLLQGAWEKFEITPTFDIPFGLIGVAIGWLLHVLLWTLLPRRSHTRRQQDRSI